MLGSDGRCVACALPSYWDSTVNQCRQCADGMHYNSTLNQCYICPQGYNFDIQSYTCKCMAIVTTNTTCPSNLLYNPNTRMCECSASMPYYDGTRCLSCVAPNFWLASQKQCVSCPANTHYNSTSNICISCPPNTTFNPNRYTC